MTYRQWTGKNKRRLWLIEREIDGTITPRERHELARISGEITAQPKRRMGVIVTSSWVIDEHGGVHPAGYEPRRSGRVAQRERIRQRIAEGGRTDWGTKA